MLARPPRGQLWHWLAATLGIKLLALTAALTFLAKKRWILQLRSLLTSWHDVMTAGHAGQWPRIDYEQAQPTLAGLFYAWLGTWVDADSARLPAIHGGLMLAIDLLNVALFQQLARELSRRYALPATLVFALTLSSLLIGPVTVAPLVVLSLLIGYRYHKSRRPLMAALAWGLGACLHPFPWLAILAQAAAFYVHEPASVRPRAARAAPWLALATWLLVQGSCAWLCWKRTHGLDPYLSIVRSVQETTPSTLVTLARIWFVEQDWARAARVLSVGLVVACLLLPPRASARAGEAVFARTLAAAGLAAVLFDRVYPPEWNLCVYPFVLLGLLQSSSARVRWVLALCLLFDLSQLLSFPIGYTRALHELGELAPAAARLGGHPKTVLWALEIALRTLLGVALLRELYGDVESRAMSAWLEPPGNLPRARAMLAHPNTAVALAALLLTAQTLWFSDATNGRGAYSDEKSHMGQIEIYCRGDTNLSKRLTMIPGYHAVAALAGKAVGDCSDHTIRKLQVWLAGGTTLLAFLALLSLHSQFAVARTLQFYFLPMAFPYYFFVYTDVLSLLIALSCLLCMLHKRFAAAALFAALSIGVRQTNVILVLLIGLIALIEEDQLHSPLAFARSYLAKVWPATLVLLGFVWFVWWNDGVAVGDREKHEMGFHVSNVFFGLALWFFVSLPANVERLWKERDKLLDHGFLIALFAGYAVYMLYFNADHKYNFQKNFVRNDVLRWVVHDQFAKSLFFIPVALGFATLWFTPLKRKAYWSVLLVAPIILVPEQLIESRYVLLPVAIWSLLRRDGSRGAESLSAFSNAAIGIWLVHQIMLGSRL